MGAGLACIGRGAEAAGYEPRVQQRGVDAQPVELRPEHYGAIRLYPGPVSALYAGNDDIVRFRNGQRASRAGNLLSGQPATRLAAGQ